MYEFHPLTQSMYSDIYGWFRSEIPHHILTLPFKDNIGSILHDESFRSSAYQFHTLFHSHFFKVRYAIEQVFGFDTFLACLDENPFLFIVDIGCGTGAATSALLESVLRLREAKNISEPINVAAIGCDPNRYSLVFYDQVLKKLKHLLHPRNIGLYHMLWDEGIPHDTVGIIRTLDLFRRRWNIPYLAHVFLLQVNVVSPLSIALRSQTTHRQLFNGYSIKIGFQDKFGELEAANYRAMLESAGIDQLHILTVGTNHYMLPKRVAEMGDAITKQFSLGSHKVETRNAEIEGMVICNPADSYWRAGTKTLEKFYVNVSTITNSNFHLAHEWMNVTSAENIELAWARVRRELQHEAFFDDVEIRLFERDLDANLERLRKRLLNYARYFLPIGRPTEYRVPKNESESRPRGLLRIEEEILSVAIIQQLGNRLSDLTGNSYAYQLSARNDKSEYLYRPFWECFSDYLKDAKNAASEHKNASILRTDLSSFYTRIVQEKLDELAQMYLSPERRVSYFLRLLFDKNLDASEVGKGIVQGGIGSGFYANIYLMPVDQTFGRSNIWRARFFRYVDDIILVVPNPANFEEVKQELTSQLAALGLELNLDKTEEFHSVDQFVESIVRDETVDQLSKAFYRLTNALSKVPESYAVLLDSDEADKQQYRWRNLEIYRRCLFELGYFITPSKLARNIYRLRAPEYLPEEEAETYDGLTFPEFPRDISTAGCVSWAKQFRQANPEWVEQYRGLRQHTIECFKATVEALGGPNNCPRKQRQLETRLRYIVGRFVYLGFSSVSEIVANILCETPWLIRKALYILEHLARQGFQTEINTILNHYSKLSNEPENEYMRAATIRALRYLPQMQNIDFDWDMLADRAVNSSLVEKLMATETWLYRNPPAPLIGDRHITPLIEALNTPELPPARLVKNYLVLIGRYAPSAIAQLRNVHTCTDRLVQDVLKLVQQGETIRLFDYEEPDELKKYYSVKYLEDRGSGWPT